MPRYGDGCDEFQPPVRLARYHERMDTLAVIEPKIRDLGGFSVRRVLPQLRA